MSENVSMRLVIMRHGAIPANERRQYAGMRTDEPLSEAGVEQARAAGVCPVVSLVYVSPLARARQTAQICFPNAEQQVVAGLAEMDFGTFEGRSADEMVDDAAYRAWVDGMCEGRCPGGETRAEFTERTVRAVEQVVADARRRGLDTAVIVAHGGTVMSAMSTFAKGVEGGAADYYPWHVGNCQGYRADVRFEGEKIGFSDSARFESLEFMGRE